MCVYCAEMKLIRKYDAMKWSHAHVHGVRIRAANGNDASSADEKFVPASQGFKDWTVPDKLRKICIERPMQFGRDNGLELTQSIPEFDARKAVHIPGFPRDVRFSKGGGFGVARVRDKR